MAMAMAMGKEEVVVKVEVVSLQVMQRTNIHLDLPHPREIHYQPLLAQRPSCPIVPPTAHGQRKTIRSSGTHLLLHISRALTEGNQRWPPINCAVENPPGPLVGSPTCDCHLALHYSAQVFCYRDP
jgi:hypothetical protein